ncbi:hypothetical protein N8I77_007633 [Diaporthe amygdali]|uniref:Extracellular membrane protein CFEM domain-containing protein n=1 Tax=Phomopsis amygdali TaxID=1214568 RepID=A0AAD9SC31_PHOAM|nr:hypothetical protein N8I77_007633 [Diaporthe amygdali]
MLLSRVFSLLSLALSSVYAQSSSDGSSELAALAAALPTCGLKCFITDLASSKCTDAACVCSDTKLMASITTCVTLNCTIPDALVVKNISSTACGVPVRDEGKHYDTVSITLGVISGAVIIMRLGFKLFIAKTGLGLDDWFILATILVGVPSSVITSQGLIPNGLGRDIWTLTPAQITNVIHYFYFMAWLYFLQLALLKTSLLFFYLKIFPNKTVRWLLWGTLIFNGIWGILFALLAVFQCKPISFFWDQWDGLHAGFCPINTNSLGWANAAISIVEDVWMLAIPLSQLHALQLHWKKKIGVAIMFCTGTFVTVISVVRLQSLITFGDTDNPTWNNLKVSLWSTIEINVGIITCCMPTLRLILLRAFPRLSSTYRSTEAYYAKNGGTNQSRGKRSRNRTNEFSQEQPSDNGKKPSNGIEYSRGFTVQFHDAEASSQVQLRDLDSKGFAAKTSISECSA